ncbi:MAG: hypothetical protein JW395_3202 [Nitrospira sp.]|nr:hypothetical protein [Nitrospira sp.]
MSEANLPQMTARLHDVFSMVERGQFSIAQGAKVLDENWQAFVAAGTDANGRLSDSLIEIIRLNYEFGTSSKEIAKYMKDLGQSAADAAKTAFDAISSSNTLVSAEFRGTMDQLKDLGLAAAAMAEFVTKETKRAVGGLNASLKIGADALGIVNKKKEELGTLMADYADKVRRGFNEGSSEMDGLRDKIQALQAEIAKQGLLVDATVIRTQGAATAFGASIYATFNQMVASGMSAREALKALEPSIASLGTQLAATGFTGGAAFADIAAMAAIAANEIAGPTLTAVEGIDQVLIGLHNSGLLTQEMFTGLTSSVSDSFNALINQGFDGNRVMRLMQPTLQHVCELMEDFGYEVDDATLALIQQGKDAGLVGDAHRNAQDVAVTAMNAAAVAMQNVANVLERVFGGAGDDSEAFAARARAALGTIPTSITVEVRGVYIPPEIPDYEVPDIDLSGVVPMAEGGQGYVDKPTLFLAGEAGPEQFAFSGAGKQFSQTGNSRVGHDDEVHQELVGVRRELAESREDLKRLFRVLPNQLVAAMLTRG